MTWPRSAVMLVALAVTVAVPACGGDSDAGEKQASAEDSARQATTARLTRADLARLEAMAPDPPPYKGFGFDRGSKRDKVALMTMFRQMQRDFYAGDGRALCQRFGTRIDSLPELDASDGKERIEECAGIVTRTAKKLADGDVRWPPRQVGWVRIYADAGASGFGGVTAESNGDHPKIRVGFVKQDGRWYAHFRIPGELPAMNSN